MRRQRQHCWAALLLGRAWREGGALAGCQGFDGCVLHGPGVLVVVLWLKLSCKTNNRLWLTAVVLTAKRWTVQVIVQHRLSW